MRQFRQKVNQSAIQLQRAVELSKHNQRHKDLQNDEEKVSVLKFQMLEFVWKSTLSWKIVFTP